MRVDLAFTPYRLALTRPWASAHGHFGARCGWLVSARTEGARGYGDCAPLPAAGTETPAAAWRRLCEARRAIHRRSAPPGAGTPLERWLQTLDQAPRGPTPAADFALDCALSDLASRLADTSLRRWLAGTARDTVPVNGALGALMDTTAADLAGAARAGLLVVKLKVGIAPSARELMHLHALGADLPPGLRLRLDANGAWDQATAIRVVDALAGLPVESLEEPLHPPDWPALVALQARASFPLALDESVAALAETLDQVRYPVRRIVLKPAAIGGLRRTLRLARRFQAAGIETVITSLVESAAGLWPTAQLAAAIGSPVPQGLATADWLREDLGPAPPLRDGLLHLPAAPGSGFVPAAPGA